MKISVVCLIAPALLAGCADLSADHGMGQSTALIQARTGASAQLANNADALAAINDEVNTLLATAPLSEDGAVQIAIINNRSLQATYSELGIAEADVVQAGRLANPGFSFNHTRGDGVAVIDRSVTFNIINLLTMPLAGRIEARRFSEAKLRVAHAALDTAAQTRIAYIEAIAAQQSLDYANKVLQAADAVMDLTTRMVQAGNWSQLDLQREQLFYAQASGGVATAEAANVESRERLTQLLGLSGPQIHFQLPDHLQDVPAQPFDVQDLESVAVRDRLDIQAAKIETERVAAELGLTKTLRFVNVLELGPALNTNDGSARAAGYQINLEIPLFDWGEARVDRAEALYMNSAHRLAAQVINVQSQVRSAYASYRSNYDIAQHFRDQIVPLQKKISAENLLRYNGMLISVFDLLNDARDQINVVNANMIALKDFWIADARLQFALGRSLQELKKAGAVQ